MRICTSCNMGLAAGDLELLRRWSSFDLTVLYWQAAINEDWRETCHICRELISTHWIYVDRKGASDLAWSRAGPRAQSYTLLCVVQ